jgi:hypothetical protein
VAAKIDTGTASINQHLDLHPVHVHGLEKAGASQMRQSPRVVAIRLVGRDRLERLVGLPAFNADHGEVELTQPMEQGSAPCARSQRRSDDKWHPFINIKEGDRDHSK